MEGGSALLSLMGEKRSGLVWCGSSNNPGIILVAKPELAAGNTAGCPAGSRDRGALSAC